MPIEYTSSRTLKQTVDSFYFSTDVSWVKLSVKQTYPIGLIITRKFVLSIKK